MHIKEAKSIGWKRTDRRGRHPFVPARRYTVAGVIVAPVISVLVTCSRAPRIRCRRPRSRSILPFCFRQQAIRVAGPLGEPLRVVMRIVPAHADYRLAVILRKPQIVPRCISFALLRQKAVVAPFARGMMGRL